MIGRRLSTGSFRLALGLGSANSASGAHAPGASTLGTSTHAIGLPAGPATFTIVAQHQQQRAASAHHQHHVRDPDALDDIGAVDDGHTGRPGADGSESRRGASATTSAAGGAALDPANAAMQSASDLRNRPDPGYRAPAGEPFKFKLVPYNPFFPTGRRRLRVCQCAMTSPHPFMIDHTRSIVERELAEGVSVPVGRHQKNATAPGSSSSDAINGVFYKSTVVSRKHASFAVRDGRLYLSDCKSLGGTFVNAIRLAPASKESEPVPLFHGDIIQFGVDYRPDVKTGQGMLCMLLVLL